MEKEKVLYKRVFQFMAAILWVGIWAAPGHTQDLSGTIPLEGKRIQFAIQPDGYNGTVYVDSIKINDFRWLGESPLQGTIAFRHYGSRNFSLDNLRIAQVDGQGVETVLFSDSFERDALGDTWSFVALGEGEANPGDIEIYQGELNSDQLGDTAVDSMAFPLLNLTFAGKKTIFEFTLTARWGETSYNPGVIIGTKQFGLLIEMIDDSEGYPFASASWGRKNDAWSGGMGISDRTFDKLERYKNEGLLPIEGKRFQYIIDPDALHGSLIIGDFKIGTFTWLNDPLDGSAGGFGFRRYGDRINQVDNVRLMQIDAAGSETILFTDDFNRTDLGNKWVPVPLGASIDPGDFRIENNVLLNTNASGNDAVLFPHISFSFEGKTTIFEFTLVGRSNELSYNPAIVIGNDMDGLLVELLESNGLPTIVDEWGRLGGSWQSGVGESVTLEEYEKIQTGVGIWMVY